MDTMTGDESCDTLIVRQVFSANRHFSASCFKDFV